jgi:predicted nucleotidyltransferase
LLDFPDNVFAEDKLMPTTLSLPPEAQKVIDRIVERFHPQKIILFGSHATGMAREDSDYDLLVVMETEKGLIRQAAEIAVAVDHHIPVDVLVRRPEHMVSRPPGDIILRDILETGVVVYEG